MWLPTIERQLLYPSNTNDANYLSSSAFLFLQRETAKLCFVLIFFVSLFSRCTPYDLLLMFCLLNGLRVEKKASGACVRASSYMSLISLTRKTFFYIKGISMDGFCIQHLFSAFRWVFLHFFFDDRQHRGIKIVLYNFIYQLSIFQRCFLRFLRKRESWIFIKR